MNEISKGINFKSFTIENGRSFEKVNIPLSNQGIVLIQGDNGVGKSSLWDIFEAVLYGSTPDEHKKDELTKNDNDANYTICFEVNDDTYNTTLKRKKGKWSYSIQKNNTDITEHSYNDAIKSMAKIIGLTKAEFEGSVHLTQSAQHILIKSELAERKKYIANFFGIDDRYDQIHLAAKQEHDKTNEQINKLAGLSHSKQMLEDELSRTEIKDVAELESKQSFFEKTLEKLINKLDKTNTGLATWKDYKQHILTASLVADPELEIKSVEQQIIESKTKLESIESLKLRNEQAQKVNRAIDELESTQKKSLEKHPEIVEDAIDIFNYEKELQNLLNIQSQTDTVENLKQELTALPKCEELPLKKIEDQLLSLQIEYQTHAKNKVAKEKGICTECGSKFTTKDVQKEVTILAELRDSIDALKEDYTIIKDRNVKAKRRKMIEEHLAKIPEFKPEYQDRITYLKSYIQNKKQYQEAARNLQNLTRMDVVDDINADDMNSIKNKIQDDYALLEELKKCQIAKKLLPKKPKEEENALLKTRNDLHTEITNVKVQINNNTQAIGGIKSNNEAHKRMTAQLEEINKKLDKLEDLKKEEYFWAKLVDAYGPKGLRIQQLEKMMNIIIQQLPVYSSVLFREKKLSFKHKVDPNNIKILACREETSEDEVNKFEHDISSFSGGEKDLMSTSFILTLADCVPHRKKTNILILDEVDAQLDTDAKYRFTNILLPMLKKKHDTIFVISHNKEVQSANIYDQVWEIKKTNHISSITMNQILQYN
jgi:DNA repair exonuclease SbcCD ATPase subunit